MVEAVNKQYIISFLLGIIRLSGYNIVWTCIWESDGQSSNLKLYWSTKLLGWDDLKGKNPMDACKYQRCIRISTMEQNAFPQTSYIRQINVYRKIFVVALILLASDKKDQARLRPGWAQSRALAFSLSPAKWWFVDFCIIKFYV